MKNSRTTVFLGAGIFLSAIIFAGCVSLSQKNSSEPAGSHSALQNVSATIAPVFKDLNSSPGRLPAEINREMWPLEHEYHFTTSKWEFNAGKSNEIILYAHDILNETQIEKIQGKRIGYYTIRIVTDIEYEKTRSEVSAYLNELMKDPNYQISSIGWISDPNFIHEPPSANYTGNFVELWCWGYTPENKKLDNTMIKGWKIEVYPMAPPPTPPTTTKIVKASPTTSL